MFDLKSFRKKHKLTQKEVANILGCGQPNVSAIENGNRDLEPTQRATFVTLYGEKEVSLFEGITSFDVEPTQQSQYVTYLLPMGAAGGSLCGFAADCTTLESCEQIISPIQNVDFAITVYGDSMAPEYPSGSRILIKKINPSIFIDWGKAYVLDTSNGVIVKEVHESNKDGHITCHSINPDPKFSDFDVPMSEIYGMYRVLMCMSMK